MFVLLSFVYIMIRTKYITVVKIVLTKQCLVYVSYIGTQHLYKQSGI